MYLLPNAGDAVLDERGRMISGSGIENRKKKAAIAKNVAQFGRKSISILEIEV